MVLHIICIRGHVAHDACLGLQHACVHHLGHAQPCDALHAACMLDTRPAVTPAYPMECKHSYLQLCKTMLQSQWIYTAASL